MKGKTVLITGASSGFGAAMARTFAREGARLVLAARRKEKLKELAKELKTEVLSITLDVCDRAAVERELHSLPHPVDVLINNAGLSRSMDMVWDTSPEDCDLMIDTNVKGLLNVSRQIIPKMLKAGSGHIINVGSISSHDTYPGGGVYCATKFAVKAITDTLRKELVATPLRVSLISPGMAKTEFSDVRFKGDKARSDSVYENIEALSAEDVAEATLFIASRPAHVNVADLVLFPTNQASVSLLHRN
ncbi:MAG: SDR family NAD(P)-dependent oxidoreductase [Verrucomicrobia bacterium]|nr:SDR family NAD(P)-dependent oxidoreductase [Verrucomicrobiota bacterium]